MANHYPNPIIVLKVTTSVLIWHNESAFEMNPDLWKNKVIWAQNSLKNGQKILKFYLWDHPVLLLPPLKVDFEPQFLPLLLPNRCHQPAKVKISVTQPFLQGLTRLIRNNGCIASSQYRILLLEKTKMIVSQVVNSKQNYFSTLHKIVSDISAIFFQKPTSLMTHLSSRLFEYWKFQFSAPVSKFRIFQLQ